eukprot:SM004796S16666  [mRNA]  locus=s4796:35:1090:- [translate_table: standard]
MPTSGGSPSHMASSSLAAAGRSSPRWRTGATRLSPAPRTAAFSTSWRARRSAQRAAAATSSTSTRRRSCRRPAHKSRTQRTPPLLTPTPSSTRRSRHRGSGAGWARQCRLRALPAMRAPAMASPRRWLRRSGLSSRMMRRSSWCPCHSPARRGRARQRLQQLRLLEPRLRRVLRPPWRALRRRWARCCHVRSCRGRCLMLCSRRRGGAHGSSAASSSRTGPSRQPMPAACSHPPRP